MPISWRFIIALPLGLILGAGVFVGLLYSQLGIPSASSRWAFELIQKKEALAAAVAGPRLLIVAGSNALYGINAQQIEEKTGCHTINLGTHGGLGLDYFLYLTQKVARSGDTVLLALEYEHYASSFGFEVRDDYVLARDPDFFRQLSLLDKINMATRIDYKRIRWGSGHRRIAEDALEEANSYAGTINDHGDEMDSLQAKRMPSAPFMSHLCQPLLQGIPSETTHGFEALASFFQWARSHQITVLATFPNTIYRPEYDQPTGQNALKIITHFYTSHGVPIIGTAREAMLPAGEFYNSYYHLTKEAALERTDRLLPELKPYLKCSK